MPPELLRAVAERSDAQSARRLASTSKAMFAPTRSIAVKLSLLEKLDAPPVQPFASRARVLRDVMRQAQRVPYSDAGVRADLLKKVATLIPGVQCNPANALFNEFLRVIGPLGQRDQADALTALVQPERFATGVGAGPRVRAALGAIESLLPNHRGLPLAALIGSLHHLPVSVRSPVLDVVQASIQRLAGLSGAAQPLAALASQLHNLTQDGGLQLFDFIASEVERLPLQARGAVLDALAEQAVRLVQ